MGVAANRVRVGDPRSTVEEALRRRGDGHDPDETQWSCGEFELLRDAWDSMQSLGLSNGRTRRIEALNRELVAR